MGWLAMLADVISPSAFRRRAERRREISEVSKALRQQAVRKSQLIGEIGGQLTALRDTDTQMMHHLSHLGAVASRSGRKKA